MTKIKFIVISVLLILFGALLLGCSNSRKSSISYSPNVYDTAITTGWVIYDIQGIRQDTNTFVGMNYMDKTKHRGGKCLVINCRQKNWPPPAIYRENMRDTSYAIGVIPSVNDVHGEAVYSIPNYIIDSMIKNIYYPVTFDTANIRAYYNKLSWVDSFVYKGNLGNFGHFCAGVKYKCRICDTTNKK